jgi:hypothetical protein
MKVVGFGSKSGVWNEANFALAGPANYRPGAGFEGALEGGGGRKPAWTAGGARP